MKNTGWLLILCFLSFSCQRLDDFLYAPNEVEEYLLNDVIYEYQEFDDVSFLPSEESIHPLVLKSENAEGGQEDIYAYYIGDTNLISSNEVLVYCHGNSGNIDYYWQRAALLTKIGVDVLIMDYQGYGKSTGEPYEEGLYKDVDVCLQWLVDRGLSSERMILYGFSMGSAPATELSANPRSLSPKCLILEAPFASGDMLVNDATPLNLPGSYATNLEIDNSQEIKKVNEPFLWLHGEKDDFLSREYHGQVVYDNYQGDFKDFHLDPEAGHSNFPSSMGMENYLKVVSEFVFRD